MIEIWGTLWLRPVFLALVPVAVVLGVVAVRRAGRLGAWQKAFDPELLAAMRRMGRVETGSTRRAWLPAAVLVLVAIALAGPAAEKRSGANYRNLDAVLLVLDLSPSVAGGERMFDMITTARLIVDVAGTRQTAAVVFAGEAYVAAPLSTDGAALGGTLALLDSRTMPVRGSRPETGLALAGQMLGDAQILVSDVVLISDGAGIGAEARARTAALREIGATVSTLHVPVGDGGDPAALRALAVAGGGVAATLGDPYPVVRAIRQSRAVRLALAGWSVLALEDLGRFVLVLALVPALFLLPGGRRS